MRRTLCSLLLLVSFDVWAAAVPDGSWRLDRERSSVRFMVTKFHTKVVEGRFSDFDGEIVFDSRQPSRSFVRWRVLVGSVETGEPQRDRAIQAQEFLDARSSPELSFVSRRVAALPDGRLRIDGTISIRGLRKPLTVVARPVSLERERPVYDAEFEIDRVAFGVDGGWIARHGISRGVKVQLRAVGVPQ